MVPSLASPGEQFLKAYADAVFAKDVETFVSLYDESVCIFDMWGPNWIHQGLKDWRAMAQEWFGSLGGERVVVEFEKVQAKQSSEMAFVSAFVKFTGVSQEGKPLRWLQNRMSCVLELKSGHWKVVHEQTSAPVDSTTLKATLQRTL